MSFRFWRRIKVAPGVTLNLSKLGGSLSFGPRGSKITVGSRGKRATVGIPGTGLFYTRQISKGAAPGRRSAPVVPEVRHEDRLTLGFFQSLVTPDDEKALVEGCHEMVLGNEDEAIKLLETVVQLADAAYLAGFMALKYGRLDDAARFLEMAAQDRDNLGKYFAKYGVAATMDLPITDEVSAYVSADISGVLLGLVEVYQRQKRWKDAIACLAQTKTRRRGGKAVPGRGPAG